MPETHPLFPSGDWDGFYTYVKGPQAKRHPMPCSLNFLAGKITGNGNDEVGTFSWRGTYDTKRLQVDMVKVYLTHEVRYRGFADENGIWGSWALGTSGGGFHLWPKNLDAAEEEVEELEDAMTN